MFSLALAWHEEEEAQLHLEEQLWWEWVGDVTLPPNRRHDTLLEVLAPLSCIVMVHSELASERESSNSCWSSFCWKINKTYKSCELIFLTLDLTMLNLIHKKIEERAKMDRYHLLSLIPTFLAQVIQYRYDKKNNFISCNNTYSDLKKYTDVNLA